MLCNGVPLQINTADMIKPPDHAVAMRCILSMLHLSCLDARLGRAIITSPVYRAGFSMKTLYLGK